MIFILFCIAFYVVAIIIGKAQKKKLGIDGSPQPIIKRTVAEFDSEIEAARQKALKNLPSYKREHPNG